MISLAYAYLEKIILSTLNSHVMYIVVEFYIYYIILSQRVNGVSTTTMREGRLLHINKTGSSARIRWHEELLIRLRS